MLKKLKRKFILIVMVLVGAVLIGVLGMSMYSSYANQRSIISGALDRNLDGELNSVPTIGGMTAPQEDSAHGRTMLALTVEVSSDGVVLQSSEGPVYINSSVLSQVVDAALNSGQKEGYDGSIHVSWKAKAIGGGAVRIAIVDTTDADFTFQSMIVRNLEIVALGLLLMFAITWFLADWALKPVSVAWEQQKSFIADASHELKTPLAVISANNEILERAKDIPAESRRWIKSNVEEANHMKGLVNDLLQLARADECIAGLASAMRIEPISLSEMVEQSALEFDAVAFENWNDISTTVQDGIVINADREWMERLIRILIENACKYASPKTTISVSLARQGQHVVYSVNNRGAVIDPQELPHVFDRFYRSDKARSRTKSEGGFGLGLAIAKATAEAHGGSISVTSNEQAGTTFTVVL